MPYQWSPPADPEHTLTLWPHQSLPPRGFALFIGVTFTMLLLPLVALLGTVLLWGLLPFLMLALAAIWFAIYRSRQQAQILEVLTLSHDTARLVRHTRSAPPQEWSCNRHWATPHIYKGEGPVPHYITLRGNGREVEIGAFLSEEERLTLYDELRQTLRDTCPPNTG